MCSILFSLKTRRFVGVGPVVYFGEVDEPNLQNPTMTANDITIVPPLRNRRCHINSYSNSD